MAFVEATGAMALSLGAGLALVRIMLEAFFHFINTQHPSEGS